MTGFLRMNYKNVQLNRIYNIILLLFSNKLKTKTFIRSLYLEKNLFWEENIDACSSFNLTKEKGNIIELLYPYRIKIDELKNIILLEIVKNKKLHSDIYDYIEKFQIVNNEMIYIPTLNDRLRYSFIRDFLIELGIIKSISKGKYLLPDNNKLLLDRNIISPDALKIKLEENEALGRNAELKIIEHEQKKLLQYAFLKNFFKIIYVAEYNVSAGYDIISFDEDYAKNKEFKNIFIEVKAVSILNYRFHWSKNEIQTAKGLKENYFLYLLPYNIHKDFVDSALKIVRNPYEKIFNGNYWSVQEDSIIVERAFKDEEFF